MRSLPLVRWAFSVSQLKSRMLRALVLAFVALCCFLAFPSPSWAQDAEPNPNVDVGLKPYESLHGGDIDQVEMSGGGLVVRIPIYSAPQRGGKLSYSFSVVFNSKMMGIGAYHYAINGHPITTQSWLVNSSYGFHLVMDGALRGACNPVYLTPYYWNTCSVVTPDGASHPMGQINAAGTYEALDTSGFQLSSPGQFTGPLPQFVLGRDGTRYTPSSSSLIIQDTNANQMTLGCGGIPSQGRLVSKDASIGSIIAGIYPVGTCTDTLGRATTTQGVTDFTGCTGPLPTIYASEFIAPGVNGAPYIVKFCSASVPIKPPGTGATTGTPTTWPSLQSIVLPNGTAWTFLYDTTGFGDLAEIILPTGGSISYTWAAESFCNSILSQQASTYTMATLAVASRTTNANDGTGLHKWTYTWGAVTCPPFLVQS
jgi:hypothetical protein